MEVISLRAAAAVCLCGLIASCGPLPRGAGLQSEVLAASDVATDANGEPIYDFAVFEIQRNMLSTVAKWPLVDQSHYHWPDHKAQPSSLLIAEGDTLDVTIWDAEENSLLTNAGQRVTQMQKVAVSSDGRIFIPFVGNLRVAGMSPQTARAKIEEQLAQSIPSAQVQLSVNAGRANTVNLVGGVNSPGTYTMAGRDYTILSLLSDGAGVRPNIDNPQVRLMRGRNIYGIALAKLYDSPALDTTLVGGDRVIVEEDERYFLSLGATGSEALHKFPKETVSALDALSIVGGVSDTRANPQGILVLREYKAAAVRSEIAAGPPKSRVVFTLDLTTADGLFSAAKFAIQDGDLVYATESPVNSAQTIFSILGSVLGLASRL